MLRWLGLIVALIACFAGLLAWQNFEAARARTSTHVESGSHRSSENSRIFAAGIVEGVDEPIELRFESSGRIQAVFVQEGDTVQINQVLAEQDAESQQLRVAQAEAYSKMVEAEREKLIASRRSNPLLQPTGVDSQLRVSPAAVASGLSREDQIIVDTKVTAAQLAARYERVLLEKSKLIAPIEGTVLSVKLHTGEMAGPGPDSDAITLVNRSKTRVRAFVEEFDADKVSVELAAIVIASGHSDVQYPAKVLSCSPYVQPKSHRHLNPGERLDVRVREIVLELDDPTDLLIGLPVEVFIMASRSRVHEDPSTSRGSSVKRSSTTSRKKERPASMAP